MRKVKKKKKLKQREKEAKGETRRKDEENKEIETGTGKRRCEGVVSVEAFEILSQGGDSESCGGVSWDHLSDKPEDLSDRGSVSCSCCA